MVSTFHPSFLPHHHYILEEQPQTSLGGAFRFSWARTQEKFSCSPRAKVTAYSLRNDDYFMGTAYIDEALGTAYY